MNSEVKNALTSKTIIGALVTIAATGAKALGYDIGDPDQYVNEIIAALGAVLSIYGRITATKRVRIL